MSARDLGVKRGSTRLVDLMSGCTSRTGDEDCEGELGLTVVRTLLIDVFDQTLSGPSEPAARVYNRFYLLGKKLGCG